MDKKQQASQLREVAANAQRKGHFGAARNARLKLAEVSGGYKMPAKKAADKKTAAKKAPEKKTAAKKA